MLKASGIGLLGLAGVSSTSVTVAAHEKIDSPATDLLGPIQVPADSEAGFNYPYYLYLPETSQEEPVPMLVEPNNTGSPSDDLDVHRSAVENRLADGLGPQLYSKALVVPLLVPVFPRPEGDIAPRGTYTHALDEDAVELEETPLARVDRQLIKMIEHAQGVLEELSYPVADDVVMNGFSASGNFVNRFAALHPDRVRSLSAGGINGTPILPLERAKGHELDYPIGIADIEALTGDPFDEDSWRNVSQLLYMGAEDENDTIPFDDAWSDRHQRVAVDVYGEDMQEDRMPYSESVYDEAGADATFRVYDGVGHSPAPLKIQEDIAGFHRRNAELKRLSFTRQPGVGDTTVRVDTSLYGSGAYRIRVRSEDRGDITETAGSVTTGAEDTATVGLGSAIEDDEAIVAFAVPESTTNPDEAVASVRAVAKQLPLLAIVDAPTPSRPRITLEYGVSSSYGTSSPIHLYVREGSGGSSLLTTFEPGTSETGTFDLSDADVALSDGTELSFTLTDIDDNSDLASDATVVGDGSGATTDTASVAFSTQPTDARESLDIRYSVADGYEPGKALTLQGEIGDDTSVLLGALTVGAETTETFSLERIPAEAGQNIRITAVDEGVVAADSTVLLRDTDGAVSVRYTDLPTDDSRSGTVEYSVDESYDVADSLTLRVYDGTLYGDDPGDAVALLSPGDADTATFTIGEDTDADIDDPVVAVVDDVPLALATGDAADQRDSSTGEGDTESSDDQSDASTEEQGTATAEQQSAAPSDQGSDAVTGETTSADGPGFGVVSTIASVSGLGYLLKRRSDGD